MQRLLGIQDRLRTRRGRFDPRTHGGDGSGEPAGQGRVGPLIAFQFAGHFGDFLKRFVEIREQILGGLFTHREAFDDEQVQHVHRDGDVFAEQLREFLIPIAEVARRVGFDVEDADHLVVQPEGHGQRARRVVESFAVEGVGLHIGAVVGFPTGGDPAGDSVALLAGVDHLSELERIDVLGDHEFELARAGVEQSNFEVVEAEFLADVLHDLAFQKLQPLCDIQACDGRPVQMKQFGSGAGDGLDPELMSSFVGDLEDEAQPGPLGGRCPEDLPVTIVVVEMRSSRGDGGLGAPGRRLVLEGFLEGREPFVHPGDRPVRGDEYDGIAEVVEETSPNRFLGKGPNSVDPEHLHTGSGRWSGRGPS